MKNDPKFAEEIKEFRRIVDLSASEEDLLYTMLLSAFKDGQIYQLKEQLGEIK